MLCSSAGEAFHKSILNKRICPTRPLGIEQSKRVILLNQWVRRGIISLRKNPFKIEEKRRKERKRQKTDPCYLLGTKIARQLARKIVPTTIKFKGSFAGEISVRALNELIYTQEEEKEIAFFYRRSIRKSSIIVSRPYFAFVIITVPSRSLCALFDCKHVYMYGSDKMVLYACYR